MSTALNLLNLSLTATVNCIEKVKPPKKPGRPVVVELNPNFEILSQMRNLTIEFLDNEGQCFFYFLAGLLTDYEIVQIARTFVSCCRRILRLDEPWNRWLVFAWRSFPEFFSLLLYCIVFVRMIPTALSA